MLGKPQATQFTLLGLVQKLRFNYHRRHSHCLLCEFMIEKNQIDDKEAIDMLKMGIALNDTECLWWRKEIVDHWRLVFTNRKGFIPTLDQCIDLVGVDRAERFIPQILEYRRFENSLRAYKEPCHFCKTEIKIAYIWAFGLAKPNTGKIALAQAKASLASLAQLVQ